MLFSISAAPKVSLFVGGGGGYWPPPNIIPFPWANPESSRIHRLDSFSHFAELSLYITMDWEMLQVGIQAIFADEMPLLAFSQQC